MVIRGMPMRTGSETRDAPGIAAANERRVGGEELSADRSCRELCIEMRAHARAGDAAWFAARTDESPREGCRIASFPESSASAGGARSAGEHAK